MAAPQASVMVDPLLDTLFAGEADSRAACLVRKEFEDQLRAVQATPNDRGKKRALFGACFRLVTHVAKRRIPDGNAFSMEFQEADALAIDFGIVSSNQTTPEELSRVLEAARALQARFTNLDPLIPFHTVTWWLSEQYRAFMGFHELQKMAVEEHVLADSLDRAKGERAELQKELDAVLLGLSRAERDRCRAENQKIQKLIELLTRLRFKARAGQTITADERKTIFAIENSLNTLVEGRNQTLKNAGMEALSISRIGKQEGDLATRIDVLLEAELALERHRVHHRQFVSERSETTRATREEFVADRIKDIQTMVDMIGKRLRIEPIPLLVTPPPAGFLEQADAIVRECERNDPELFRGKFARLKGKPSIIPVPGEGNGVYSFDQNVIILPWHPAGSLEESVVTSIILYRWDADDSRDLRDSYAALKCNRNLGFVDLQKSLVKNYLVWITKECRGYKVMEKDLRDWFLWKIAPKRGGEERVEERPPVVFDTPSVETLPVGPAELPIGGVEVPEPSAPVAEPVPEPAPVAVAAPEPPAPAAIVDPVPSRPAASADFEAKRAALVEKLEKLVKSPRVAEKIRIRESAGDGDIDIELRDLKIGSEELELILNALLIQAKLRRFDPLRRPDGSWH